MAKSWHCFCPANRWLIHHYRSLKCWRQFMPVIRLSSCSPYCEVKFLRPLYLIFPHSFAMATYIGILLWGKWGKTYLLLPFLQYWSQKVKFAMDEYVYDLFKNATIPNMQLLLLPWDCATPKYFITYKQLLNRFVFLFYYRFLLQ